jgi:hypothetical protein
LPWKRLLPDLRRGQRLGPLRLKTFLEDGERRLREEGFPKASLQATLEDGGAHLRVRLVLGAPTLIRELRIEGHPAPYDRATLLKISGLSLGHSRWTPKLLREAQRRLRQRLVKDHRLEGSIQLRPAPDGPEVLILQVESGPQVVLKTRAFSRLGFLWGEPSLLELVPLTRAERYAPSLLDEGDGRISAYFRDQGFPEVKVSHTRTVTKGTEAQPWIGKIKGQNAGWRGNQRGVSRHLEGGLGA